APRQDHPVRWRRPARDRPRYDPARRHRDRRRSAIGGRRRAPPRGLPKGQAADWRGRPRLRRAPRRRCRTTVPGTACRRHRQRERISPSTRFAPGGLPYSVERREAARVLTAMKTEQPSPRYSAIELWSPGEILDAMIEG